MAINDGDRSARGGQEKLEAKTHDELLKKVQAKTAENLTELMKRKNNLSQEEAKHRVIVNGFEEQIRALEEKRSGLKEQLLQASGIAERREA